VPDPVRFVGAERVIAKLRRLGLEAERAAAEALNKTAFEVLDAEEAHLRERFEFSQRGAAFLARSFQFAKATPQKLEAVVEQRRAGYESRASLLGEHELSGTFEPTDPGRLPFGEQTPQAAVPIAVKRDARGRIPNALLPGRLLKRGKAFVRGNVIVETGTGRLLYALVARVRIKKRIEVYTTALATAERVFASKVERAIDKVLARATS